MEIEPIKEEKDYQATLKEIESLLEAAPGTPEGDRLDVLSVAPLLGEVIRRAHEGRSVGEMFNE